MKNLLRLFLLIIVILLISCNNDTSEEIILDPLSEEIELFPEDFGAKEFETLEAKELEASEKHRRHFAFTKADVINPILGHKVGKSKLIRGKRGVWTRYRSNYLTPGYTYTLWWIIWNNPENCGIPGQCGDADFGNPDVGVELMNATGRLIGRNGKGTFYACLKAGDDSESVNDLFGLPSAGGLQKSKTFGAQVTLVIRSHGPAIPGQIYEQISSYTGGCTDPFAIPPFTEIPDEEGECADIEFSVHEPVN